MARDGDPRRETRQARGEAAGGHRDRRLAEHPASHGRVTVHATSPSRQWACAIISAARWRVIRAAQDQYTKSWICAHL